MNKKKYMTDPKDIKSGRDLWYYMRNCFFGYGRKLAYSPSAESEAIHNHLYRILQIQGNLPYLGDIVKSGKQPYEKICDAIAANSQVFWNGLVIRIYRTIEQTWNATPETAWPIWYRVEIERIGKSGSPEYLNLTNTTEEFERIVDGFFCGQVQASILLDWLQDNSTNFVKIISGIDK